MTPDPSPLVATLRTAFTGETTHVRAESAFDGLDWRLAGERPAESPHSIYRILAHLNYWQDLSLAFVRGDTARWPEHAAEGWPGGDDPGGAGEWSEAVGRFERGIQNALELVASVDLQGTRGKYTLLDILRRVASHNSYHLGQIVLLRRILGAWPPPGGGETW